MTNEAASLMGRVPDYVSPDRVVDFDFYNDRRFAAHEDLHDGLIELQAEAPDMFWTPLNGGHWVIMSNELAFEAVRTPELFSNRKMTIPALAHEPMQIPINLDPPEHGAFRKPLMQAFSPKAMNALQDDIRALAIELIEKIEDKGECDFVTSVGEPLPVMIFMKLMGMPLEKLAEFRVLVHAILSNGPEEGRMQAFGTVAAEMGALIAARSEKREDDLISRLLDIEVNDRPVTRDEMQGYCLLLFVAGLDTVANGMAFGVRHLARDQELQKKLRENPAKIPEAAEELLRRYTFTNIGREVARDEVWHGIELKEGERVLIMLPAANLDARAFPDPTRFDLDRENKVHIAFNAGPHRCVGSHLARIELQILYDEWLKRIPTFRADPDKREKFHGANVFSIDYLPLVWKA